MTADMIRSASFVLVLCLAISLVVPGDAGPNWKPTKRDFWASKVSGIFAGFKLGVVWQKNVNVWGRWYDTTNKRYKLYKVIFDATKGFWKLRCTGYVHWPPPSTLHLDFTTPTNLNKCSPFIGPRRSG